MAEDRPADKVSFTERTCPKCGSRCATNSRLAWCVGSREPRPDQKTCLYGIDALVTIQQHREAP